MSPKEQRAEQKFRRELEIAYQYRWEIPETDENRELIFEKSRLYGVSPETVAYILAWERFDTLGFGWVHEYLFEEDRLSRRFQTLKDAIQDKQAEKGLLRGKELGLIWSPSQTRMRNFIERGSDNILFCELLSSDLRSMNNGHKPPPRNGSYGWMFSTIGPGQFNIYFAAVLFQLQKIKGNPHWSQSWVNLSKGWPCTPDVMSEMDQEPTWGPYNFVEIAKSLLNIEVTIELIAAELRWAKSEYEHCGISIGGDHTKLLEMHRSGYYRYFALRDSETSCDRN